MKLSPQERLFTAARKTGTESILRQMSKLLNQSVNISSDRNSGYVSKYGLDQGPKQTIGSVMLTSLKNPPSNAYLAPSRPDLSPCNDLFEESGTPLKVDFAEAQCNSSLISTLKLCTNRMECNIVILLTDVVLTVYTRYKKGNIHRLLDGKPIESTVWGILEGI